MRIIIATLAAAITLLVPACELYQGDDVPTLDAGNTCVTGDRATSCRSTVCRSDTELCLGADWTQCLSECLAGEAIEGGAWCPGQRSPTSD